MCISFVASGGGKLVVLDEGARPEGAVVSRGGEVAVAAVVVTGAATTAGDPFVVVVAPDTDGRVEGPAIAFSTPLPFDIEPEAGTIAPVDTTVPLE